MGRSGCEANLKNAQRSKTVKVLPRDYANESSGASIKARFQKSGPVHPHMLRHCCGFSLANRGYDLRLIQDDLGHRDPKHTVHYTRVAAGALRGPLALSPGVFTLKRRAFQTGGYAAFFAMFAS